MNEGVFDGPAGAGLGAALAGGAFGVGAGVAGLGAAFVAAFAFGARMLALLRVRGGGAEGRAEGRVEARATVRAAVDISVGGPNIGFVPASTRHGEGGPSPVSGS